MNQKGLIVEIVFIIGRLHFEEGNSVKGVLPKLERLACNRHEIADNRNRTSDGLLNHGMYG